MRARPRLNRTRRPPTKRAYLIDADEALIDEYEIHSWMIHQPADK